ncbi:MAG: histidine kinase [Rhizobacter sp.]|nr:histidine kinase [Rhizobacter sp.]
MLQDGEDALYYQVAGLRGEWVSGERKLPPPPEADAVSSGEVRFRDDTVDDQPVRIAYLWVTASKTGSLAGPVHGDIALPLVQVAETLGKRSRLATEIVKGVILPQFVILPLAVLLVWLALARGITPLNELQRRIRLRDSHDLSPIDEREAPEEVSPLVRAINDLLARLDHSIRTQKHFLADAAHQLKTPLAGLRTQAELAQRQIDAGSVDTQALKASLNQIAHSSQRAAHMVNQLLSMARAENHEYAMRKEPVSLSRLAPLTVRDFVPRAMEKQIDLGYEGPSAEDGHVGLMVNGQAVLLGELIRNLVDNALAYTPAGGTVTVRVVDDPFGQVVVLQVEDSGPGIPTVERERVFMPFYRGLGTLVDGSGLGLAIVQEIALVHDAQITLDDAQPRLDTATDPGIGRAGRPQGCGARFTVRFTALPSRPPEAPDDSRFS